MSFRCQMCNATQPIGPKGNIILERYDAGGHYYFRPKDNFEIN